MALSSPVLCYCVNRWSWKTAAFRGIPLRVPTLTPLRRQPERWLFTGFITLLLAPVVAQGLDRPLASLLRSHPSGVATTSAALAVALVGWLVTAAHEPIRLRGTMGVTGLVAVALGLVLGVPPPGLPALAAVAVGAATLARWLPDKLPPALDGLAARHRALTACYALLALLSVVQVSRVSVFMADPTRTDAQVVPGVKFIETHSCLTAYVRAHELAQDRIDNLYLAERWPQTIEAKVRPKTPFSPFDIDAYLYPPPFLLIPSILAPLRGDFLAQRAAWFGINGLLLAVAFWIGARDLGGPRWHRPLLLAPPFFASLPVLSLLQIGNAQASVVVISVLAMLAFERDRPALGGFALALATMAKISPGILGVILIVQRRWRALAWTVGFGALLSLLTLVAFGPGPIESFVRYALPRVGSGQAFSDMLHHPPSIALNMAPSGTPFKLALLGVDVGDPWPIARSINHVVTLAVLVLAVIIGRRRAEPAPGALTPRALSWMALVFLTALRSPFAPGYVIFSFVWAVTLLATEVERRWHGVLLLVLFAVVTLLPPLPPERLVLYLALPQLAAITVSLWLILRRRASTSPVV